MKSGLNPIYPHRKDFSLLHTLGLVTPWYKRIFQKHTYGSVVTTGLPVNFSVYDFRPIPNQEELDTRFTPPKPAMPDGCTAESCTFDGGIQDGTVYDPFAFYLSTPPHTLDAGRDIRDALQTAIDVGFQDAWGNVGYNRTAYFNCYGAGAIDDYDAARIGLYINQAEKRSVIVGSYWYWGDTPATYLSSPSYNTSQATLHCYLVTGWQGDYLELIPWIGQQVGNQGRFYLSREVYNKLMSQPYTGAFTITKTKGQTPIPIGMQAWVDHLVYFIRSLFNV